VALTRAPQPRLIVMAKAPRAGAVKTRLVPALGAAGAAALAARLLEHAVLQAVAAQVGVVELCGAPDLEHPLFRRLQREHGLVPSVQGEGDLGRRMQRALDRALDLGAPACLMGTDAPALDAACLRAAFAALRRHDAVFVPAFDGGYALVGLRRRAPPIFADMPWSTPAVMALTRERLAAAGWSHAELPPVHDIDEPADLVHLPPALAVSSGAP
jgi:uncharacterized protein